MSEAVTTIKQGEYPRQFGLWSLLKATLETKGFQTAFEIQGTDFKVDSQKFLREVPACKPAANELLMAVSRNGSGGVAQVAVLTSLKDSSPTMDTGVRVADSRGEIVDQMLLADFLKAPFRPVGRPSPRAGLTPEGHS